jgi:hypothetical protein
VEERSFAAEGGASDRESYARGVTSLCDVIESNRLGFPPAAILAAGLLLAAGAAPVAAVERPGTPPPLLAEAVVDALAGEVSGTSALHTA